MGEGIWLLDLGLLLMRGLRTPVLRRGSEGGRLGKQTRFFKSQKKRHSCLFGVTQTTDLSPSQEESLPSGGV